MDYAEVTKYAEALRALRHAYKLTQAEFADMLQVSKPTIQKLEAGDYPPSDRMNARLAEQFRTDEFRTKFYDRVMHGDLRKVKTAFGDLLENLGYGDFANFPSVGSGPASKKSHASLCAELKKAQEIITSQQETIRNLSMSVKYFTEMNMKMTGQKDNHAE